MRRLGWMGVAAALLLPALQADAVEALSTEELAEHCEIYLQEPDGEDGIFCVRYIQGFIDGAVVTDERVTFNVAAEYSGEETFTQRAIRNRLGSRVEQFASYYAEFCLGEPVPLKTVVDFVVADIMNPDRVYTPPLARDLVYATLRREFPCTADATE